MQVRCPSCQQVVPANNIELSNGLAKCDDCAQIFPIEDLLGELHDEVLGRKRPTIPQPENMLVENQGEELVLNWPWFSLATTLFFTCFTVTWNGFLFFWYATALSSNNTPVVMIVFPLGHVAAGIGLAYYTLALYLNRTIVRASGKHIHMAHHPLPWPGQRTLKSKDITQLFCRKKVYHTKNGTQVAYQVYAILKNRKEQKLVEVSDPEQAQYIEQQIEKKLGLVDRQVEGEMAL